MAGGQTIIEKQLSNSPMPSAETFIVFEIAGAAYALPSDAVRQMEMVEHITPVPNAPPFIAGIVFSRGQVVPAVSLRRRFGLDDKPHDLKTRLIVVLHAGRTVGLIADSAREFLPIEAESVRPPPDALVGPAAQFLRGVAVVDERMILILDVERLLATN